MRMPAPPQAPRAVVAPLLAPALLAARPRGGAPAPRGAASRGAAAGGGRAPPARSPGPRAESSPHTARTPEATQGGGRRDTSRATLRSAPAGAAWTIAAVVERLRGRRIRVGRTTVPLEADTLTCGGEGPER